MMRIAAPQCWQTKVGWTMATDPSPTGGSATSGNTCSSVRNRARDHVQVHYNSSLPAQLNAHAYAQGSDIHVAPGQEQHLPHEAWHVVQQAQGRVKPTLQMKAGVAVNDDAGLEAEADVMGAKAVAVGVEVAQCVRAENIGMSGRPQSLSIGYTSSAVQRKMVFNPGTDYLNTQGEGGDIRLQGYQSTINDAIAMGNTITVSAGIPPTGTAMYTFDPLELSGRITIKPIVDLDLQNKTE